jgi:hypothetical protein
MKSFIVLLLSAVLAQAELLRGQVELAGLKGAITAKSTFDQVTRPLMAGDAIREDDELATAADGAAELFFSNGVRVQVAPGTKLRLAMFRQVKMPLPGRNREAGELPDDGSLVDLVLGAGRVTVVCPSLQARSLVSVRTPQGRSDLRREGVYELSFERASSGELVAQSLVLAGSLKFTPIGKGKALSVEANNKLLITSDLTTPTQVVLEKLKMESGEVEVRLKGVSFDPATDTVPPVVPPAAAVTVPATGGGSSATLQPRVQPSAQAAQNVVEEVVERQAQTNPSPTGG